MSTLTPMGTGKINILRTRQGVNMGDHAESVTVALEVIEGETVEQLLERALPPLDRYIGSSAYVTLRLVDEPSVGGAF